MQLYAVQEEPQEQPQEQYAVDQWILDFANLFREQTGTLYCTSHLTVVHMLCTSCLAGSTCIAQRKGDFRSATLVEAYHT